MRSFIPFAVSAALLAAASGAQAQSAPPVTGTVTIDGHTSAVCMMDAPSPPSINLGNLAATTGTRTGKLTTIANQTIALDNTFCNYGGTVITVSAQALVDSSSTVASPGFDKAVNFTANVSGWTANPATVTTNAASDGTNPLASSNGAAQNLPQSANLSVVLTNFTTPGDGFLIGGSYSGYVLVNVGPNS